MARQLRIEFPGAFYHVTSRGNERKAIFKSQRGSGSGNGVKSTIDPFNLRKELRFKNMTEK